MGMDLTNPGPKSGSPPFPSAQIKRLIPRTKKIIPRHAIAARDVVGHSDIAASRKQDPGELFDWADLANQGIGLWPGSGPPDKLSSNFGLALEQYGYDITDLAAAIGAFQRHFRPSNCDGVADTETENILCQLLALEDK